MVASEGIGADGLVTSYPVPAEVATAKSMCQYLIRHSLIFPKMGVHFCSTGRFWPLTELRPWCQSLYPSIRRWQARPAAADAIGKTSSWAPYSSLLDRGTNPES